MIRSILTDCCVSRPKTPRELPGSAARWPECETPELAVASPKPPQRSVSTPAEAAVTVERLYVPAGQERKKLIEQHMLAEEKERDLEKKAAAGGEAA